MLASFAINDTKYKQYAYAICGDHDLKHDLVNDMYIKLDVLLKKDPSRVISNGFIFRIMRNMFLNQIESKREFTISDPIERLTDDDTVLCERLQMNDVLSEMSFFDRQILLTAQEKSFRKIGKEINCHHSSVSKMYNNSLDKAKKLCQQKGMLVELRKAKD